MDDNQANGSNKDEFETAETNIDFDSLVKGLEEIQDHALNQHEIHLDVRANLKSLEEKIEIVCHNIKQVKCKNMEDEGIIHNLQSKNAELKQQIARESALVLAAEEQREQVQRTIEEEKADYLKVLQEHEKIMANYSDKFRNAPKIYSKKKMLEEKANETEELEALKAKEASMRLEVEQLHTNLKQLEKNCDLENFRNFIKEAETELLQERKVHKKEKKKLAKLKQNTAEMEEELRKLKKKQATIN